MSRLIIVQCRRLLNKRSVRLVMGILFFLIMMHYFRNVNTLKGEDIVFLMNPLQLRYMASDGNYFLMTFRQFFPLLAVIPVGFAFSEDRETDIVVMLRSRVGGMRYAISLWIAALFVGFLTFALPLAIEYLMYIITFPLEANGTVLGCELFHQADYQNYLFGNIYLWNEWIYGLFQIGLFAVTGTVISTFTMACATLLRGLKIILFLPIYILVNGLYILGESLHLTVEHYYYFYLCWYSPASEAVYVVFLLVLFAASGALMVRMGRRDWIE